jgi:hypothetical protein
MAAGDSKGRIRENAHINNHIDLSTPGFELLLGFNGIIVDFL